MIILPWRLNYIDSKAAEKRDDEERSGISKPEVPITFMLFLRNKRAMLALTASMFAMVFMLFFDSILSDRLTYEMGVSDKVVGMIFCLLIDSYRLYFCIRMFPLCFICAFCRHAL